MIELFRRYVGWRVMAQFLANPNTPYYIKELSRVIEISPASASSAVKSYEKEDLLSKEEKGLAHIYSLNMENPLVSPLRKAYGIALIFSSKPEEKFLVADPNMISLAFYGSYVDGSFDEKSDIDFLVVTPTQKEKFVAQIKKLEDELGREVSLSVFKLSEWRLMAEKEDAFYKRVTENHILLSGSGLK